MAQINRGTLPRLTDRIVNKVVANAARRIPPVWKSLANVQSSKNSFERETSFDPMGWVKEKPEGTSIQFDRPSQGYSKDYVMLTYALGGIITFEAQADKRHAEMVDIPKMLTDSAMHSINAQVADLVVNGFGTTYYSAGDGIAAFSASHTFPNGRTYSSLLSAQVVSPSAVASAIIQIRQQKNARNQPLFMGYGKYKLIYATSQTKAVFETLETMQLPYSGDNTESWVARQKITPIENQYFTGNEWLLIADDPDVGFTYWNRMDPVSSREGEWNTGDVMYKIVYRNAMGLNRALGMVGSQGA